MAGIIYQALTAADSVQAARLFAAGPIPVSAARLYQSAAAVKSGAAKTSPLSSNNPTLNSTSRTSRQTVVRSPLWVGTTGVVVASGAALPVEHDDVCARRSGWAPGGAAVGARARRPVDRGPPGRRYGLLFTRR